MRVVRYLALVLVSSGVAIATVHQHVQRTQLGYEAVKLEKELSHLEEAKKAALLEREHAAAPEKLLTKARALGIASEADLRALVDPVAANPAPKKASH